MLAKLIMLLHSKIGIAIVGAVLVAGGGAVVATATGATSRPPLASFVQNGSHSHEDDDPTKSPNGVGEHQEIHGVVASVNSAGFILTVQHEADDDHADATDEHGTPAAASVPKSAPTTSTLTVMVTADTKFEGMTKSFADLMAGMHAEVGGAAQSDGSFLASKVEASNSNGEHDNDVNDQQQVDISGAVTAVGASSFTLKDEHGTVTITVSNTTTFDGVKGITDLKVGIGVEVQGAKQTNGSIAAQHVQAEVSEYSDD